MTGTDPGGVAGAGERLFATTTREGVIRLSRSGMRWLSTGWRGGRVRADAAYSVTVPEGWACRDVGAYVRRRIADAGMEAAAAGDGEEAAAGDGDRPVLITGVDAGHARGARRGPVEAYATAGLSNPAALPVPGPTGSGDPRGSGAFPDGVVGDGDRSGGRASDDDPPGDPASDDAGGHPGPGTVNVVVGTDRALAPGALANLVAVAAEARAATLLATAGVPGTTTDAVVAACDPGGDPARYSGSATPVGRAARVCVRDAVLAALGARYPDGEVPAPDDAEHGVSPDRRADVFRIDGP